MTDRQSPYCFIPDVQSRENYQKCHVRAGKRFGSTVAVRMFLVGRLFGGMNADEADDVRCGVGEGVEAVRQDADCAARVTERDLRGRDGQIEEKNADEDARNRGIPLGGDEGRRDEGFGIRDEIWCRIHALLIPKPDP